MFKKHITQRYKTKNENSKINILEELSAEGKAMKIALDPIGK